MLSLDPAEWRLLDDAYGPAENIPQLLAQLTRSPGPNPDPNAEPWFSLWSRLCHQSDVYTASYAAAPHIVHTGLLAVGPIDLGFFLLPACIEIARANGRGPAVPSQLEKSYRQALNKLHECAFKRFSEAWDEDMALSIAAALAAAKGQIRAAETIVNLDENLMERIIAGDF